MKRLAWILLAAGLCYLPDGSPISALGGDTCPEGTLIYWHEYNWWICEEGIDPGPVCHLCQEQIDVEG
jgi:hypothetical protein